MKKTLLIASLFAFCGCTTRTLTMPDGREVYKSTRFGNKESIKRVEYRSAKGEVFILEGYDSDQVQAIGIAAEAAARGAVSGLTGGYKLAPKNDQSEPQPEIE